MQPRIREVEALYESRPYPPVGYLGGLFQRIRWEERQTLNYRALFGAAWGSTAEAAARPRILVAGCGTFEPLVVALANPFAEIVAVDLSARSLAILKRQARLRGLGSRIFALQADLTNLPESLGSFDFIIATGVLHHLPDPAAGLRALVARSSEKAVFRFMIYSYWGRSLLYGAKALAEELGVKTPAEFRRMIDSLPADHPYKIYFHLYSDSRTDTGVADGFLHPCDQAFTASGLRDLLSANGLTTSLFLHGPQPQLAPLPPSSGEWDRLAILEALGELQENFRFVARRSGWAESEAPVGYDWNEALPARGRFQSQILGKEISFDKSVPPAILPSWRLSELARGLFLVPRSDS
ncbi:MAG: class I SAM-dependent methyltransferase [Bdellovibrionota bacterium]